MRSAEYAGARTIYLNLEPLRPPNPLFQETYLGRAEHLYVWIPSIKTVIAGDTIYRGVHVWTAETTPDTRKAWDKTLDQSTALQPTVVIAGHKDPKLDDSPAGIEQTRQYLRAFDASVASSTSAAELEQKMKTKFKELQLDVIAHIGAGAALR